MAIIRKRWRATARHAGWQNKIIIRQRRHLLPEQFAKFWLMNGQKDLAAVYLKQAHNYYGVWGADAKVRLLKEKYAELLPQKNEDKPTVSTVSIHTTNGSFVARPQTPFSNLPRHFRRK